MMLARRIIPCLDVKDGRVVKGIHFENLRDAGDPVELGARYSDDGADELVFLDITATIRSRRTIVALVEKVAKNVFIPFTVGGGISTVEQMDELLRCGAEKCSLNTAAVKNPDILTRAAQRFGNQCVVLAIDARRSKTRAGRWQVTIKAGTEATDIDAVEWAVEGAKSGAGEILLTSMDADGTQTGYDIELTRAVADAVTIPVIASGGAGTLEHLYDAIIKGRAEAVLMASITHFENYTINQIKEYLRDRGIEVNL
ncbi:MAG: imidazole glycerol phosphate synthase subunit HisF [Sedimentisphaerales bacterium]|nr:imidazole glycerol phosphate synthase subunit HisF [Sedimentisphaerales bacterium]